MKTETSTTVNALIIINNDRYEGYKKAASETEETDLKTLFTEFSIQSKDFADELRKFVSLDEQPEENETTNSGKLYRVWMDVKAGISGKDRKAILSSCEFGEDFAKKTYDEVMEQLADLPPGSEEIIKRQRVQLQRSHDTIKELRDSGIKE
ncbi:MAG: PA2169 family four-helix-bundle protein [Bacteroidetes bacterium]|nr:PA2169 family four-helix-bundle protein [Bacteroidota bacterium]